jgi:hypothetical protein
MKMAIILSNLKLVYYIGLCENVKNNT